MVGLVDAMLRRLFPPAVEPLADTRPGRRAVVRGRVVPRDLMSSPLSGETCVYYRFVVEAWRASSAVVVPGMRSGFWIVEDRDEAIAEFYLDDGSARAVIAPHHVIVSTARAQSLELGTLRRAAEARITAGDLVEVEGFVEEVDDLYDEARDYRAAPVMRMLRGAPGEPLSIRSIA
jgi:hypothetical protein